MKAHLLPLIEGIDPAAQQIINQRWPVWCSHITRWLSPLEQWRDNLLWPENRQCLIQLINTFKQTLFPSRFEPDDPRSASERIRALNCWHTQYLLPLAQELGLQARTTREQIRFCWRRGWFDQQRTHQRHPERPALATVQQQILEVLATQGSRYDRVMALCHRGICSDEATATTVLQQLERTQTLVIDATWELILATTDYGAIGLLKHSDYPCINELFYVERYAHVICQVSDQPDEILSSLRADIIALYTVLHQQDEQTRHQFQEQVQQKKRLKQKERDRVEKPLALWRSDMLERPRFNPERTAYQAQWTPELRAEALPLLARARKCDAEQAEILLDTFVESGLVGLIARHANVSWHVVMMKRFQQPLDTQLGWLESSYRQEIERLAACLLEAIEQLQCDLSLFPLFDTYLGSTCRRKARRWLRKHTAFIERFAQLAGLDYQDATGRLFAFAGYGGLGLLRFYKWQGPGEDAEKLGGIIDRRLSDFIHFQKLAHPEERPGLALLQRTVNTLAEEIGHPLLSLHVVHAFFNRLAKTRYWNSGQGAATAASRQRSSLRIRKTPELHRAWVLVPVELNVEIVDDSRASISDNCSVLLVLDHDSALPLGCWASIHSPGAAEVGLALYQAIWHVGWVDWPLRATPGSIEIPTTLDCAMADLGDLQQAAIFLMLKIEQTTQVRHWHKLRLVRKLRDDIASIVEAFCHRPYATVRQVQDAVLDWLYTERLQTQNAPDVPSRWRNIGYTMPAFDSPAAGWLLPVVPEKLRSVRDGVICGETIYTSEYFDIEPGHWLRYRMFPYTYNGTERGLFVEWNGRLAYLRRNSHRLP